MTDVFELDQIEFWRKVYANDPDFLIEHVQISLEDSYRVTADTIVRDDLSVKTALQYRAGNIARPFTIAMLNLLDTAKLLAL